MKHIFTEPLVHFLAIGLALFALYALVNDRSREPPTIVVSEDQIATMREGFGRTWGRAPTAQEMKGLIDSHVREEVLYREGLALGLERDDSLIRRRVRQKVEFLSESMNGVPEPDEVALQSYLHAHRDRFKLDARFTFAQVYLGAEGNVQIKGLLTRLNGPGGERLVLSAGRPTQLEAGMDHASSTEIARTFGTRFASALADLPVGAWQGPVASDFGLHLVRVAEREPARVPPLAEVRDQVKRDWLRAEIAAAAERYYAGLRARYEVRIEHPRVAVAQ